MAAAISVFLGLSSVFLVTNLFYLRNRGGRRRGRPTQPRPFLSVLVPVRDEQDSVAACLDSLLEQDYGDYEIILLDDHSRDGSLAIMQDYAASYPDKIRVQRSRPLPEGWTGKTWACHQLSRLARGSWLVFTDADTVHASNSLSRAWLEARARDASLVSYLPDLVTVSLSERILMPFMYFAFFLLFPLPLIRKLRDRQSGLAVGTFIMVELFFQN